VLHSLKVNSSPFGLGGTGFVAQLLSLVVVAALCELRILFEVCFLCVPEITVQWFVVIARDCVTCLMHVLAFVAAGIDLMTASFPL
jgi:hypothetical protein